jgi:hypothetical protein
MTRKTYDVAARRRGELTHDRGSRRLVRANAAQRRLTNQRSDGPRTKTDPHGPHHPRHAYVTQAQD